MSYARSMEEAKAAIKSVEPNNEASMSGSPILRGKDSGGPEGKGELSPKTYVLVGDTKTMKRTL